MEWVGGTKEAKQLIEELQKSGDLIDVYSDEYFKKRNDDEFYPDRLKELIKKHGYEFLHHLLIGCFHSDHENLMKLVNLVNINDQDRTILMSHNAPSLVFINLKTQSILCFGLWKRKAQTIEKIIYTSSIGRYENFEKLDHLNIVDEIREAFEEIARGIYPTLNGLSQGELDDLYEGQNGNFFRDEYEDDGENEGMTQEEVDERNEELTYAKELRENGEYRIQKFFSKFTLDYFWD